MPTVGTYAEFQNIRYLEVYVYEHDFICYTSKWGNPCAGCIFQLNIITVLDPVPVAVVRYTVPRLGRYSVVFPSSRLCHIRASLAYIPLIIYLL